MQKKKTAIVFDMDNTIIDEFGKHIRSGFEEVLLFCINNNFRLVLWTNSTYLRLFEIFRFFPQIFKCFDTFITRESYDIQYIRNRNCQRYKDICLNFRNIILFDKKYPGIKYIPVLGYKVLIEDDPAVSKYGTILGIKTFICRTLRSKNHLEINSREILCFLKSIDN